MRAFLFLDKDSHFPQSLCLQIWVTSNPRGAERLAPGIIAAESDFYPRRLWGKPSEVCILRTAQPKFSVTNSLHI